MTAKQIYFIRPVGQLGPIKIGCSKHPKGRLDSLAIQSPLRLEIVAMVPGNHADERRLHGMFREHWLHHEWFGASKDLLALLDHVLVTGALPLLPEGKIIPLPRPKRRRSGQRRKGAPLGPSRRTIEVGRAARAEYEANGRLVALAKKYGVAPPTMRAGLIAAGATIRRYTSDNRHHVVDVSRAVAFRRRYEGGDTLQEIAQDHGITRERVRQILRKTGVPSLGWRSRHVKTPAGAA